MEGGSFVHAMLFQPGGFNRLERDCSRLWPANRSTAGTAENHVLPCLSTVEAEGVGVCWGRSSPRIPPSKFVVLDNSSSVRDMFLLRGISPVRSQRSHLTPRYCPHFNVRNGFGSRRRPPNLQPPSRGCPTLICAGQGNPVAPYRPPTRPGPNVRGKGGAPSAFFRTEDFLRARRILRVGWSRLE